MSDLDLSQGVETGFKATIAEAGEYTLAVELINAGTYETIDEAGVKTFTVAAPVFNGLVSGVIDTENGVVTGTLAGDFAVTISGNVTGYTANRATLREQYLGILMEKLKRLSMRTVLIPYPG